MLSFYLEAIDSAEDKSKFEILFYSYYKQMLAAANRVLNDMGEAEDAVQNAFIAISKNIKSVPEPDTYEAKYYCIKAAKNTALNMLPDKKDRDSIVSIDYARAAEKNWDDYFTEDSYSVVVECIKELDPTYKEALYYHYVCGLKIHQVAPLIGVSTGAASKRIQRGRVILQQKLEKRGIAK
ncbi:MAG: sigma-70 family RNA polymerase sigma factor [Acutalibacteraceae bacterium]|nr:sigma-70 family RNA polymerase sigma factor [Acutalibacteraceae bacterium]